MTRRLEPDCAHVLCGDTATRWVTPSRGLCRAHALEYRYLGRLRRKREGYKATPRPPAECGTRAAAQRHRRLKEPVCAPCLAADAKYTADRKAARLAQQGGLTGDGAGRTVAA